MEVVLLWVILSLLIGWWALRIGVGWWTGFVFSLVLSPLLGAIIVAIMATPRRGPPPKIEPVPKTDWYSDDKLDKARAALRGGSVSARVEPPLQSAPPTLSAERMAAIEAEERYRAEVRARLAAERGNGGQG